jgi:hypothetical protein
MAMRGKALLKEKAATYNGPRKYRQVRNAHNRASFNAVVENLDGTTFAEPVRQLGSARSLLRDFLRFP